MASCSKKNRPGEGLDFLVKDAPIEGDTTYYEENKNVKCFQSVYLYDANTVYVEVGKKCALSINGPKCYVQAQSVSDKDGTLFIKFKDHDTHYRKTNIKLTVNNIDDLEIKGCKKVIFSGKPYEAEELYIELNHVECAVFTSVLNVKNLTLALKYMNSAVFKVNSDVVNISTQRVEQTSISGKAKYIERQNDRPEKVDLSGLQTSEK